MIGTKTFYFTYIIALPMIFSGVSWWAIILGWVVMHLVAGFLLAIIFQPAHVLEHHAFHNVEKNTALELDNSRLEHQLLSSANFGTNNKILTYLCGGLNFQIEHHLFPNICHVHYKAISKIVKKTAEDFNLPYNSGMSFIGALRLHGQFLKSLGRA